MGAQRKQQAWPALVERQSQAGTMEEEPGRIHKAYSRDGRRKALWRERIACRGV